MSGGLGGHDAGRSILLAGLDRQSVFRARPCAPEGRSESYEPIATGRRPVYVSPCRAATWVAMYVRSADEMFSLRIATGGSGRCE
jgi:hypothetical protein